MELINMITGTDNEERGEGEGEELIQENGNIGQEGEESPVYDHVTMEEEENDSNSELKDRNDILPETQRFDQAVDASGVFLSTSDCNQTNDEKLENQLEELWRENQTNIKGKVVLNETKKQELARLLQEWIKDLKKGEPKERYGEFVSGKTRKNLPCLTLIVNRVDVVKTNLEEPDSNGMVETLHLATNSQPFAIRNWLRLGAPKLDVKFEYEKLDKWPGASILCCFCPEAPIYKYEKFRLQISKKENRGLM